MSSKLTKENNFQQQSLPVVWKNFLTMTLLLNRKHHKRKFQDFYYFTPLGSFIHLVRMQNFPKNLHFLPPDTHISYPLMRASGHLAYVLNEWSHYITLFYGLLLKVSCKSKMKRRLKIQTKNGKNFSEAKFFQEKFKIERKDPDFQNSKYNLTKTERQPLSTNSTKMVKHNQTIWQLPKNSLSVFYHFVGLALKGIKNVQSPAFMHVQIGTSSLTCKFIYISHKTIF